MGRKLTTEEFIQKSKEIHGDKYDYSKVEYKNAKTKVIIICKKHGIFYKIPDKHLSGSGCKECAREHIGDYHKLTTDLFIKRAKEIHNNTYDYSKVDYKNYYTKVNIICPIHGEFLQLPSNHLKGKGCLCCSGKHRLTTKTFIQKATNIHGDKYDYSKVNYINNRTEVEIICKKHGSFWQKPTSHLNNKSGCPLCSKNRKLNTQEFIKNANIVHNNKYNYSNILYKKSNIKVCIVCKEHGEFWQTPANHLKGQGCPKCGIERTHEMVTSTTEKFISKSILKYKDKYDYSKVKYQNALTKVCIVCKEHGEFWQTPANHLFGYGCPKCKSSKGEIKIMDWLKNHNIEYDYQYRFDDCRYKYPLPFDFYIPSKNLCIEFDGKQHFESIDYFGGDESFKTRQTLDEIKTNYCLTNNIKLIRIRYDEFDDINNILYGELYAFDKKINS